MKCPHLQLSCIHLIAPRQRLCCETAEKLRYHRRRKMISLERMLLNIGRNSDRTWSWWKQWWAWAWGAESCPMVSNLLMVLCSNHRILNHWLIRSITNKRDQREHPARKQIQQTALKLAKPDTPPGRRMIPLVNGRVNICLQNVSASAENGMRFTTRWINPWTGCSSHDFQRPRKPLLRTITTTVYRQFLKPA